MQLQQSPSEQPPACPAPYTGTSVTYPLTIPKEIISPQDFMLSVLSEQREKILTGMCAQITASLTRLPNVDEASKSRVDMLLNTVVHELITNAFVHGMLGLTSEEGALLDSRVKTPANTDAAQTVRSRLRQLTDPARAGSITAEVNEEGLTFSVKDGGFFKDFDTAWNTVVRFAQTNPGIEKEIEIETEIAAHGRGLILIHALLPCAHQERDGTLVFHRPFKLAAAT